MTEHTTIKIKAGTIVEIKNPKWSYMMQLVRPLEIPADQVDIDKDFACLSDSGIYVSNDEEHD